MTGAASTIVVRPMSSHDMAEAVHLFRAIEAEARPEDPTAPDRAEAELRQSLAHYDFTRSDAFWLLLAELEGHVVGYAAVVRIPKGDARHGFLYVDELHVLQAYRRRGVATQLLKAVRDLAAGEGYAGVRLLVRPSNVAARALYQRLNYAEHRAILCELQVMHPR